MSSSKRNKKKGKTKREKVKTNVSNLKPSLIKKAKVTSDFGIDFIKLIDGFIREIGLDIIIFIEISKLIYSYTLNNLISGCWSFYYEYDYDEWDTLYRYYYVLHINNDYTFRLNCVEASYEDWSNFTIALAFKGYIERDNKDKYILFFEKDTTSLTLLNTLKKKKKYGWLLNKEIKINDKKRENIYLQRVLNVYKSQNIDNAALLKMHKKYIKDKKGELNWQCVEKKLFIDYKYGKLDTKQEKKKKKNQIQDVPDMHILYEKLCKFYSIKPLGIYFGNVYIKFGDKHKTVKIKWNKLDFFKKVMNEQSKEQYLVKLRKTDDMKEVLRKWRGFYNGNGVGERAKQIDPMGYDFSVK